MRRLSIKNRMRPCVVIMLYPFPNLLACLQAVIEGVEINTFIFEGTPKAFNEHIIHPAAFAIHGDFNIPGFEQGGELIGCKLATLVSVKDVRLAVTMESFFQRLRAKPRVQAVG